MESWNPENVCGQCKFWILSAEPLPDASKTEGVDPKPQPQGECRAMPPQLVAVGMIGMAVGGGKRMSQVASEIQLKIQMGNVMIQAMYPRYRANTPCCALFKTRPLPEEKK